MYVRYVMAHTTGWESAMDPIPFEGARVSHITDYTYPRVFLGAELRGSPVPPSVDASGSKTS